MVGGRGTIFLRFRGGPIRRTVLSMPIFEVEGEQGILSSSIRSSFSSSSSIVLFSIRLGRLLEFVPDFWEEDVTPTLCFLFIDLVSSSAGEYFVLLRFRFPREGSSTTRELLFDVRDITGESVARPLGISEFRELLELLLTGLLEVGAVGVRDLFGVLGANTVVSICPQAEWTQAHLDGYFSSSRPSLLPKLL